MRRALESSGLKVRDVNHVSAHATSTPAGDAAEAAALASVFLSSHSPSPWSSSSLGRGLPVVSGVKAAIGHLLGRQEPSKRRSPSRPSRTRGLLRPRR